MSEGVGSDKERLWISMTPSSIDFWVDLEIKFQSRSKSGPTFSDIDFKNKRIGSELSLTFESGW